MTSKGVKRRLTTILAADVAGYSRLVGADDEGTLVQWKAHWTALIEPKTKDHHGRIVKVVGDGILVEFASLTDAMRCAVAVQCGMAERNTDVPPDKRIEFRMGVNFGELIIDGGDFWGEGVNIAARLEALAEPGGICVSGRVHEDVQGKLDISFEDAGEQQLKNIARPVRVYRVRFEGAANSLPAKPWHDNAKLPVFENVPPRDHNFTGRETVLAELHRLLTLAEGNAPLVQVAIHGLGGIGKSSLATEFAHRHAAAFAGVWWAPAENRTVLVASLADLAGQLEPRLAQEADQEKAARAGLALISRSAGPFLLVYDNVETPADLRDLVPAAGVRVLITTRWADWGGRAVELGLSAFGAASASKFLQKRTARVDDGGAARLVQALGNLPLALDHAGAYCRLTGMSFGTYRERIDSLIARAPKSAAHPASVGATFGLAISKAAAEQPAAEILLGFCAFLAPDRIPIELIAGEIPDEGERAEALLTLAEVSLIEHSISEDGRPALTLHRLVQTAMRRRLAEQGKINAIVGRVTRHLAESFPKSAYRDASVWPRCAMLLPHVLEMRERMQDDPTVEGLSEFLNAAGSYLHRRGAYSEAEPLLKQAIAIGETALGPAHPDLGTACGNLARLYRDVGRYNEAEPLLKRSIEIGETAYGPDHPLVAARLVDLAHHYYDFGRHAEAEPIYKRAIAIGEKALGREHSIVAVAIGSLARLYRAAGRDAEAQPLFDQAIEAGMVALGREHPAVAAALAKQFAKGAPPVDGESTIASEHPDVAIQLNRLAYLHRAAGRYVEAEMLLKGALAISEQALGHEHLDIATSLNSLARLYRVAGRHDEAEPLLKEAILISEKIVGRTHPTVAIWLYNLARLYKDTERYIEAEAVLKEVVEISGRTVGRRNQGTARGQWALANLFLSMRRNREALEQANAAFTIHEETLGSEHQWTSDSAETFTAALRAVGRRDEADALHARFAKTRYSLQQEGHHKSKSRKPSDAGSRLPSTAVRPTR